jgi:hypothetical protein
MRLPKSYSNAYRNYALSYLFVFVIPYALIPFIFANQLYPEYVSIMSNIALLSYSGYLFSLFLFPSLSFKFPRLAVEYQSLLFVIFIVFITVVFVVFLTAPQIPIIESLRGADADDLVEYRESFLKARTGWESSLGYIVAVITGAIMPYFIAMSFERNYRHRYIYALFFFLYCISFLEKAFFLKLVIPVFFVLYGKSVKKKMFLIKGAVGFLIVILVMFALAGLDGASVHTNEEGVFSILFVPTNIIDKFLWRAGIVPIVTALDGVRVFITDLKGQYLMGASSSILAFVLGTERLNFERLLFQFQFGGSDTGNANQFYGIEAFINFGYIGVFLFAALVGWIVRYAINSRDKVLLAMMPLFFYYLYSAGLIGTLFSNGFVLLLFMTRFLSLKGYNKLRF